MIKNCTTPQIHRSLEIPLISDANSCYQAIIIIDHGIENRPFTEVKIWINVSADRAVKGFSMVYYVQVCDITSPYNRIPYKCDRWIIICVCRNPIEKAGYHVAVLKLIEVSQHIQVIIKYSR